MNAKTLINTLNRYYDSAIKAKDDRSFFLMTIDYVQVIYDTDETNKILQKITAERLALERELADLESQSAKEIYKVVLELANIIRKSKIEATGLVALMKEMAGYMEGKVHTSNTRAEQLNYYAEDLIRTIYNSDKRDFARKFVIENKTQDNIRSYRNISEHLPLYFQKKAEFEKKSNEELWGCLNDLILLYDMHRNGQKRIAEAYQKTELNNYLNISTLVSELEHIKSEKKRSGETVIIVQFQRSKYETSLSRVHNHLIFKLAETDKEAAELPPSFTLSLADRAVMINNVKISSPKPSSTISDFIEHLIDTVPAGATLEKESLSDWLKDKLRQRRFGHVLGELGFKGEVRKIFFENVTDNKLTFKGKKVLLEDLGHLDENKLSEDWEHLRNPIKSDLIRHNPTKRPKKGKKKPTKT